MWSIDFRYFPIWDCGKELIIMHPDNQSFLSAVLLVFLSAMMRLMMKFDESEVKVGILRDEDAVMVEVRIMELLLQHTMIATYTFAWQKYIQVHNPLLHFFVWEHTLNK